MSQLLQYLITIISLLPMARPEHPPKESPQEMESTNGSKEEDKNNALTNKTNINQATLQDLLKLPGIGPQKASAILDFRSKHLFGALEDLLKVKGIGKVIFRSIRPLLSIAAVIDLQKEIPETSHTGYRLAKPIKINP